MLASADSVTDAVDRFQNLGPVVRLDGVKIADSMADLTDGLLHASITLTDDGVYLGANAIWTGTDPSGLKLADTCADWSSNSLAMTGWLGAADGVDGAWTRQWNEACSVFRRLYCIEDSVFSDGFESGDTSAWD